MQVVSLPFSICAIPAALRYDSWHTVQYSREVTKQVFVSSIKYSACCNECTFIVSPTYIPYDVVGSKCYIIGLSVANSSLEVRPWGNEYH